MNPLVVGHDGSGDAQEAIALAGRLFPPARAVVVTACARSSRRSRTTR
jgi:hypothetical protein